MSGNRKEIQSIEKAYQMGYYDKRDGKPYINPFNKSKERYKYKAYKNGYYE